MYQLIDSHCHFDSDRFAQDRAEVYQRATAVGVSAIISPAITAAEWPQLKQITSKYDRTYPCYGLHPMFIQEHCPSDIELLDDWIDQERPIAIGECGLDFYHGRDDASVQLEIFEGHLKLAKKYQLPVIIHARRAVEDVLKLLRNYPDVAAVLHSYSGSTEQARQLAEHNIYFGFGGPVTWPQSRKLRSVVASIPIEKILLETDAPDQSGEQHRRQRNEPAYLPEVAETIAQIKQLSASEIARVTTSNAQALFKIDQVSPQS